MSQSFAQILQHHRKETSHFSLNFSRLPNNPQPNNPVQLRTLFKTHSRFKSRRKWAEHSQTCRLFVSETLSTSPPSVVWARLPIGMSRCGLWSLWNSLIQNINNHAHYYKHFFDSAEQREICKNSSCLPTSASRSALRCLPWPVFKNTIDSAGALLFPVLLVILGAEFANSGRK